MSGLDERRDIRRAASALALMSLVWGYNWLAMKVSLTYASPADSCAARFALGALALLPAVRYYGHSLLVPRREWGFLAFLAASLAVNFFLTLTALELGAVGKTAVLTYTMPFWVILIARVRLKERMRPAQSVAVALAFCGLLVLVDAVHLRDWKASVLAVIAGLIWAATVVAIKTAQGRTRTHLMTFTVWQMALCAVLLFAFSSVVGTPPIRWTWQFGAAIAFSAILGSAFAWMLFYYALARLPASLAGLGTLATPALGVLAAWVHLGERPSGEDLVGMACIALGLLLLALPGASPQRKR